MKDSLFILLVIIACLALGTAQITGIGYFLYLWSGGAGIALAMWTGFLLWLKFMGVGILAFLIAYFLKD